MNTVMKSPLKSLRGKVQSRSALWILTAAFVLLVASACQTQAPEDTEASHEDATHQEATQEAADTDDTTTTTADVSQQIGDAADTLGQYAYEQKEQFEAEAREQLAAMNARIENLGEEAAMVQEGAREQWNETVEQLESQQEDLERALEDTLEVPAESWLQARDELIQAQDSLAQMLDEAAEKLETQPTTTETGSEDGSEA